MGKTLESIEGHYVTPLLKNIFKVHTPYHWSLDNVVLYEDRKDKYHIDYYPTTERLVVKLDKVYQSPFTPTENKITSSRATLNECYEYIKRLDDEHNEDPDWRLPQVKLDLSHLPEDTLKPQRNVKLIWLGSNPDSESLSDTLTKLVCEGYNISHTTDTYIILQMEL